jgi:hypothetical protein
VPTPRIWSSVATQVRPYRKWAIAYAAVTWIVAVGVVIVAGGEQRPMASWWPVRVGGSLVSVSLLAFGVIFVVSMFHPDSGKLWREPRFEGRFFQMTRTAERWWASIFFTLFLVFALVLLVGSLTLGHVRAS